MITPELRQFVAQAMAAGQSADDIREKLKSQGWEALDVEQALATAEQAPAVPQPFPGALTLIGRSLRLFRSRVGTLVTIAAVAGVAVTVGQWLGYGTVDAGTLSDAKRMTFPGGWLAIVGYAAAMLVYIAAWFTGLVAVVGDRAPSVAQAAQEVPRKFLPLLWVTILSTAVSLGGLPFLGVPAFVFGVWFCFAGLVYLSQDIGGFAALRLSREYVRGAFWRTVWSFLVAGVLGFISFVIVAAILGGLAAVSGPAGFIFSLLLGVVMAAVGLLYNVLGYQILTALRTRRGTLSQVQGGWAPVAIGLVGFVAVVALAVWGGLSAGRDGQSGTTVGEAEQQSFRRALELAAVKTAVEMYRDESGSYPAALTQLGADYITPGLLDLSTFEYRSTGASYELCTVLAQQRICEGPSTSTAPTAER